MTFNILRIIETGFTCRADICKSADLGLDFYRLGTAPHSVRVLPVVKNW